MIYLHYVIPIVNGKNYDNLLALCESMLQHAKLHVTKEIRSLHLMISEFVINYICLINNFTSLFDVWIYDTGCSMSIPLDVLYMLATTLSRSIILQDN